VSGGVVPLLCAAGWLLAALALFSVLRLRERVARAEHELRGPLTVLSLACERLASMPEAAGASIPAASQVARSMEGELAAAGASTPAAAQVARVMEGELAAAGASTPAAAQVARAMEGELAAAGASIPAPAQVARGMEGELARLRAGLDDLAAARGRRRRVTRRSSIARLARAEAAGWRAVLAGRGRELRVDWRAGGGHEVADRGRLAQALGNLLANAAEHGVGVVELSGRSVRGGVRVEVRNSVAAAGPGAYSGKEGREVAADRGRGLAVARAAARELGGWLKVSLHGGEAVATLDLPAPAAAVLPNGRAATTSEDSGRVGAGSPAVLPNGRAATTSEDSGRVGAGSPAVLPNGRAATASQDSGRAGAGSPAVLPNGRAATTSEDGGPAGAGEGAVLIRGGPATTDQHGGEGEVRAA
jgi:hypothetical protein